LPVAFASFDPLSNNKLIVVYLGIKLHPLSDTLLGRARAVYLDRVIAIRAA
jgi:hypothetical protein